MTQNLTHFHQNTYLVTTAISGILAELDEFSVEINRRKKEKELGSVQEEDGAQNESIEKTANGSFQVHDDSNTNKSGNERIEECVNDQVEEITVETGNDQEVYTADEGEIVEEMEEMMVEDEEDAIPLQWNNSDFSFDGNLQFASYPHDSSPIDEFQGAKIIELPPVDPTKSYGNAYCRTSTQFPETFTEGVCSNAKLTEVFTGDDNVNNGVKITEVFGMEGKLPKLRKSYVCETAEREAAKMAASQEALLRSQESAEKNSAINVPLCRTIEVTSADIQNNLLLESNGDPFLCMSSVPKNNSINIGDADCSFSQSFSKYDPNLVDGYEEQQNVDCEKDDFRVNEGMKASEYIPRELPIAVKYVISQEGEVFVADDDTFASSKDKNRVDSVHSRLSTESLLSNSGISNTFQLSASNTETIECVDSNIEGERLLDTSVLDKSLPTSVNQSSVGHKVASHFSQESLDILQPERDEVYIDQDCFTKPVPRQGKRVSFSSKEDSSIIYTKRPTDNFRSSNEEIQTDYVANQENRNDSLGLRVFQCAGQEVPNTKSPPSPHSKNNQHLDSNHSRNESPIPRDSQCIVQKLPKHTKAPSNPQSNKTQKLQNKNNTPANDTNTPNAARRRRGGRKKRRPRRANKLVSFQLFF